MTSINPALPTAAAVTPEPDAWMQDAEYFKSLTEDWAFAAAVACSVAPGDGSGKRRVRDASGKVSARQFAKAAGTTADRVMRYLRIWDAAAKEGWTLPSADLVPGLAPLVKHADVPWKNAVALVPVKSATVKKVTIMPMSAPVSIIEERAHMMDEAKKDVQHIADAAFNLPEFTDEDRDQVLAFVKEMTTVLAQIKKTALAINVTAVKKVA